MRMQNTYLISCLLITILTGCNSWVNQNRIEEKAQSNFEKPNIIVILIDDAGYVDFGFMGSKDIPTPEIDKLAKSGMIFSDAHVTATVCAPSRAGLISGKYQQRFGFEANGTGGIGLSDDVVTIADVFKSNGYNTYALGKWHLGTDPSDHPNKRGFDEFYGFLTGARSYFPLDDPSEINMLQHNGKPVKFDGYMTDVLGDQSLAYIEESDGEPFFMYLAYNAVHTPMEAKSEDLERFKNHPRKELAAMTWSLDENVGKLLEKLEEKNIRDNTIIYFLSDNGGALNNQSKMGKLKGWKGNKFEGGHRVPFVISFPKLIKGNQTFDGLTSALDIFPTSLAAAKISKPESLVLDGVDLMPYLKNEKKGDPHKQLFWRKLEESAARKGDFKAVRLEGFGAVMYNLDQNLEETKDLSKIEINKFQELERNYLEWEKELIAPLWDEEESWMNVTYHIHKRLMQNKKPLYNDQGSMRKYNTTNNE